jgi:SpoVK/Ycf46/Vps4 family AAA+-type ATPase
MPEDPLIASLTAAVAATPDDHPLRLHLAKLLVDADAPEKALPHVSHVLAADPTNAAAAELLRAVTEAIARPAERSTERSTGSGTPAGFDWTAAEQEVADIAPPMFVDGAGPGDDDAARQDVVDDMERPALRLDDVGGMQDVKDRLDAAFLAPLRNPQLRALYGKSLRGGLLLYGPPGCGKTFLARAVAGELGANFYAVSLADVLDMYIGQSERNLHAIFETVRRNAPCLLFLDEVDALGQKRTQLRGSAMRGTVNQLLTELDGVSAGNEGVFVLAASNHPWDIDSALRRPGRLDRMLLVLPPDEPAREAILRHHLKDRPVSRIDLRKLASRTRGFSGADLAHLCDSAAESALLDSARTGNARMIEMGDFDRGLKEIKPSTGAWLQTARNVAMFANESGEYDELVDYLRREKLV